MKQCSVFIVTKIYFLKLRKRIAVKNKAST